MKIFNIEDIKPIDVRVIRDSFWITYSASHRDNDQIDKGDLIDHYGVLLQVEYDAQHIDGYIAICKAFRPESFPLESFPLEFIESLGVDDVVSKYVEWIKTN